MINICRIMKKTLVPVIVLFSSLSQSSRVVGFDSNGKTGGEFEFKGKVRNVQNSHSENDSIDLLATSFLDFTDSFSRKFNDTGDFDTEVIRQETSIEVEFWTNVSSSYNITALTAMPKEAEIQTFTINFSNERRTTDMYIWENKTDDKPTVDSCAGYGSCTFVSKRIPKKFQYCQCDEQCSYYNDCCEDAKFTSNHTSPYKMECIPYSTDHRVYYGYFGVTSCPKGFADADIIGKCESHLLSKVGPWVYNNEGVVFKNKYCAECHGEYQIKKFSFKVSGFQETDFQDHNWLGNFSALTMVKEKFQDDYRLQELEFVPPNGLKARRCMVFEPVDDDFEPQCTKHRINPVIRTENRLIRLSNTMFAYKNVVLMIKNRFCGSNTSISLCLGPNMHTMYIADRVVYALYPLSVVFSFHNNYHDAGNCQNTIFGECIEEAKWVDLIVNPVIFLATTKPMSMRFQRQLAILTTYLVPDFYQVINIYYIGYKHEDGKYILQLDLKGKIITPKSRKDMIKSYNLLKNLNLYFRFMYTNGEVLEIKAMANMNKTKTEIEISFDEIYNNRHRNVYNINDLRYPSTENKVCETYLIQCSFHNDGPDHTIDILDVGCFDPTKKLNDHDTLEFTLKKIANYMGLTSSIAGLSALSVIYRYKGMHIPIPSSHLEKVIFLLIILNLLSVVGSVVNNYPEVCHGIGVSIHYVWLAVFSSKTVILTYIVNNIRKMLNYAGHVKWNKTKALLTFLSLFLPLLILIPGLLVDYVQQNPVQFLYDGDICFPANVNTMYLSIPMGASMIININCLLIIPVIMKKRPIQSRVVRISNSYKTAKVLARVNIVTGICWVFWVVSSLVDYQVVTSIFILVYSFQGLFVAIAIYSEKNFFFKTYWNPIDVPFKTNIFRV